MKPDARIIISRTDSIGDVVLTLPMAGLLKRLFPQVKVIFLGRSYTKDVILLSEHIDEFVDYTALEKLSKAERIERIRLLNADVIIHVFPVKSIADLAKRAEIPLRVGTTNRLFHWLTCNKLIRLSRKNSALHEAQLNLKLLSFCTNEINIKLDQIPKLYGFTRIPAISSEHAAWINNDKFNLILHPRSKGSAKEWGLDNFSALINLLPKDRYRIFISGTKEEGDQIRDWLNAQRDIIDLTGKMSLSQFIAFINSCNGLVAASTGPLHIASALGKKAIGVFSPKRPIHPGRWAPIGISAEYVVFDKNCAACSAGKPCDCISRISPQQIVDLLEK